VARIFFLERRCHAIGGVDLGEQSGFDLAELDSVTGLKKFLERLTRRLERAKDNVDYIGHRNDPSMASNGLNATAESATQIP